MTTAIESEQVSEQAKPAGLKRPKIDPQALLVQGDRLLVMSLEADDKTEGGIVLPETARKNADGRQTAPFLVVRAGTGRITEHGVHIPITAKQGDFVLIGKFAGVPLGKDDTFRIINTPEILAIIPK